MLANARERVEEAKACLQVAPRAAAEMTVAYYRDEAKEHHPSSPYPWGLVAACYIQQYHIRPLLERLRRGDEPPAPPPEDEKVALTMARGMSPLQRYAHNPRVAFLLEVRENAAGGADNPTLEQLMDSLRVMDAPAYLAHLNRFWHGRRGAEERQATVPVYAFYRYIRPPGADFEYDARSLLCSVPAAQAAMLTPAVPPLSVSFWEQQYETWNGVTVHVVMQRLLDAFRHLEMRDADAARDKAALAEASKALVQCERAETGAPMMVMAAMQSHGVIDAISALVRERLDDPYARPSDAMLAEIALLPNDTIEAETDTFVGELFDWFVRNQVRDIVGHFYTTDASAGVNGEGDGDEMQDAASPPVRSQAVAYYTVIHRNDNDAQQVEGLIRADIIRRIWSAAFYSAVCNAVREAVEPRKLQLRQIKDDAQRAYDRSQGQVPFRVTSAPDEPVPFYVESVPATCGVYKAIHGRLATLFLGTSVASQAPPSTLACLLRAVCVALNEKVANNRLFISQSKRG